MRIGRRWLLCWCRRSTPLLIDCKETWSCGLVVEVTYDLLPGDVKHDDLCSWGCLLSSLRKSSLTRRRCFFSSTRIWSEILFRRTEILTVATYIECHPGNGFIMGYIGLPDQLHCQGFIVESDRKDSPRTSPGAYHKMVEHIRCVSRYLLRTLFCSAI